MGMISQETIEQIRNRADIVDIVGSFTAVHKRGHDFWCCCPFHREKTPSCKLNQERQGFYCFGCKEHGDVITFVKKIVNTDYPGALRWLADRLGIPIVEDERGDSEEARQLRKLTEKRRALLNDVAHWYQSLLNCPEAAEARNYLLGRGLDQDAVTKFGIGYSLQNSDSVIQWAASFGYDLEDLKASGIVGVSERGRSYGRFWGRLMFPICDELGKVVGFSARIIGPQKENEGKYVNSPESEFFHKGQLLYALHLARQHFKDFGHVLICEGQLDVIACHRAGLCNAVAAQGTAFTADHARILGKSVKKAVLSFDADHAGYLAAEKNMKILHAAGFEVSVVTLPPGDDPDSVFKKGGAEALKSVMSVTEPAIPYLFRVSCLQDDLNSPPGKSKIVTRVLDAIKPIKDEIVRNAYCQWLAEQIHVNENLIIERLNGMINADEAQHSHRYPSHPADTPQQNAPQANNYQANNYQANNAMQGNYSANNTPPPFPQMGGQMGDPAQNARNAAPINFFPQDDKVTKAWGTLLDIALHVRELSEQLAFMQDVLDALPESLLGNAINQLLAIVAQGEWETAMAELTASEVFNDNTVAQAIMASEYENIDAEKCQKAFNDCLKMVRINALERKMALKQDEMRFEIDSARRNALLLEINNIIKQRNDLKRQQ